jgi:hypothetical protein
VDDRATATWSTPAASVAGLKRWFSQARPTLGFILAYLFLSALENVRYPSGVLGFGVFLPSVDLVVLFGIYAWLGRKGRKLPRAIHAVVVALFLLIRAFRIGDGVTMRFFLRPFHFHLDAVLIPDLVRLLSATGSLSLAVVAAVLLVLGFGLAGFLVHRSLRHAERYLAAPQHARGYLIGVGLFAVISLFVREHTQPDPRYLGAFGASGVARLATEAVLVVRLPSMRREIKARIARTGQELEARPNDLKKLGGVDVFLFLIESYGETVLQSPTKAARIRPVYQAFEAALGSHGFRSVSSLLEAPVSGGGSWFAHATLSTGVKIDEQLSYDLLTLADPPALSDFFQAAGYRTVLVQPGMTRVGDGNSFRHYDQKYYAASFDYRGPKLGWGRFPDQFVIDYVHRREPRDGPPRFFEYVLVSSHIPWSAEVPVVDWARIGDGSVYSSVPVVHNPTRWSDIERMAGAYTSTDIYDFEVIRGYLAEFVRDDALVIVLGDHQPTAAVTGDSPSFGVPIHVLSRRRDLLEPFEKRGYRAGMWPRQNPPYTPMQQFLQAFLSDFSEPQGARPLPAKG